MKPMNLLTSSSSLVRRAEADGFGVVKYFVLQNFESFCYQFIQAHCEKRVLLITTVRQWGFPYPFLFDQLIRFNNSFQQIVQLLF